MILVKSELELKLFELNDKFECQKSILESKALVSSFKLDTFMDAELIIVESNQTCH
jgi:hypothetical protein